MSLIVQVAGGGGPPPPPGQQPPVKPATPQSSHGPARPPPAHMTQLTSSPHVVQHHPAPAPPQPALHLAQPQYPRPLPLSPHRALPRSRPLPGSRLVVSSAQLPTQPLPHLPTSPLPLLSPSPAHQLLSAGVNSPSLIPQSIPSALLPRLPIHLPVPGRPALLRHGPPQCPAPPAVDTNILPPHAFRRLTRPATSQPDDDIEVGDPGPHQQARRLLMSPKQLRRNFFNNLSLQDHNYCAVPPPSPPRSPTPPPSPYQMGVLGGPAEQEQQTNGVLGRTGGVVGRYPSPHYTGPPLQTLNSNNTVAPLHRLKQTIEEAGVGPMAPLQEDSRPGKEGKMGSLVSLVEDGGEETETAPEADDDNQDDSVTRCICEFQHDDGYMICCDKCFVWQHVVCMGLDRNNIPDEYLCERCSPRPIDRKRAKSLQKTREKEIFIKTRPKNNDSSDDEKLPPGVGVLDGMMNKMRKPSSASILNRKLLGKKSLEKKLFDNKKLIKKNHKKRIGMKTDSRVQETSPKADSPGKKASPRKNIRRKSLSATDGDTEDESNDPNSFRSWIDNYEEAVINHYSPELRARLQGAKLPSNQFKPKDVNGIRCNVSLRGNGMKVLTANNFIPCNTPVIECRGRYKLAEPGVSRHRPAPFLLVHKLSSELEVVVDGKTYGNDSRFCRRATSRTGESNAVVKHYLEKGSLHLYIVASGNIEKNQEILLPPLEPRNGFVDPDLSVQEELREVKKGEGRKLVNGSAEGRRKVLNNKRRKRENAKKKELAGSSSEDEDEEERAERDARIAKEKERLAKQREEREKQREKEKVVEKEKLPSPRKTRSAAGGGNVEVEEPEVVEKILEPVNVNNEDEVIKTEDSDPEIKFNVKDEPERKPDKSQLSIVIPKQEDEKDEKSSSSVQNSPAIKSPAKAVLGLPDQTGLIIGVNTINYDVSFRNKAKTREERKMEMIMKAIEAMERQEARKRQEGGETPGLDKPEKKRRRSNSVKAGAADSNLEQSSAEEGSGGPSSSSRPASKGKGRGRRQTGGLSARRRSRAKSGDSSAVSETELVDELLNGDRATSEQFKYPRNKKSSAMADQEPDDDVSKQYIRGSRSPPGIANHLLRSARTDKKEQVKVTATAVAEEPRSAPVELPSSIGCSAKKRWLRAAMSADMSEEASMSPVLGASCSPVLGEDQAGPGSSSPAQASPEPDYTPLKKRRLANYAGSEETAARAEETTVPVPAGLHLSQPVNEKIKSLPNGLKKRLITNMVLEAVLDKAMEDFDNEKKSDDGQVVSEVSGDPMLSLEPDLHNYKDQNMDARQEDVKERSEDAVSSNVIVTSEPVKSFEQMDCDERSPSSVTDTVKTETGVPCEPSSEAGSPVPQQQQELELDTVPAEEKQFCDTPLQDEAMSPVSSFPASPGTPVFDEQPVVESGSGTASCAAIPSVPSQHKGFKSFFSTDLSVEDIDRELEARREELAREVEAGPGCSADSSPALSPGSSGRSAGAGDAGQDSAAGPHPGQTKKRMSLADYKKRRQESRGSGGSRPSTPTPGPALPTSALPSLPALPGLEPFNKHERKKRAEPPSSRPASPPTSPASQTSSQSAPVVVGGAPALPEHPREDLTERLRKEFGLNIDESDGDSSPSERRLESARARDKDVRGKPVRQDSRVKDRSGETRTHEDKAKARSQSESKSGLGGSSSSRGREQPREKGREGRDRDGYRDSREPGYRDKGREYRDTDIRGSKRAPQHGGGPRRPPYPSSPTGPGRGLHNQGGARRPPHHPASPSRRNSQDTGYSHSSSSSSYYKGGDSSRRNNFSRNFYPS